MIFTGVSFSNDTRELYPSKQRLIHMITSKYLPFPHFSRLFLPFLVGEASPKETRDIEGGWYELCFDETSRRTQLWCLHLSCLGWRRGRLGRFDGWTAFRLPGLLWGAYLLYRIPCWGIFELATLVQQGWPRGHGLHNVPRPLRRSWCLEMVWDEGLKCWMIRHPIVRMLCRCSSCVQGLWNGHDAPTNGFWVTGAEFFSTFSGLAFSMVVAHEFALVLGKLNFRKCNSAFCGSYLFVSIGFWLAFMLGICLTFPLRFACFVACIFWTPKIWRFKVFSLCR